MLDFSHRHGDTLNCWVRIQDAPNTRQVPPASVAARHPRGPGPLPAPPSARTVPILPGVAGAGPLARVSGRHGVMGGGSGHTPARGSGPSVWRTPGSEDPRPRRAPFAGRLTALGFPKGTFPSKHPFRRQAERLTRLLHLHLYWHFNSLLTLRLVEPPIRDRFWGAGKSETT